MSIFPKNTFLGELKLVEVYDYYSGPKFFCASNNLKQYFIVYWIDHRKDDDALGWLYLPVSEKRLDEIRRAQKSVYEACINSEVGTYLVYTPEESSNDTVEYVKLKELSKNLIPPNDVYVKPESVEIIDRTEPIWIYEFSIKSINKKLLPSTESVSQVLRTFQAVFGRLMVFVARKEEPNTRKTYRTYPLNAVFGSFNIKFSADDDDVTTNALKLFENIVSKEQLCIGDNLRDLQIDPFELKSFFESVRNNRFNIVISPRVPLNDNSSIEINGAELDDEIALLEESSYSFVPSIKVPQANDINKVIHAVFLVSSGEELLPEKFNGIGEKLNSHRQVKYYADAAYTLGLLTKAGSLTSAGRFLLSNKSQEVRYQILSDRFESSDFGWTWMKWSNVNSIVELDPGTAAKFIFEAVPGLGKDTAKRRATTLVKWLNILRPYHRQYDDRK